MKRSKVVISSVVTLTLVSIVILTLIISPSLRGIIKLELSNKPIVEIAASSASQTYMSKSKNSDQVFTDFMKNKGFTFVDQQGSSYFYQSKDERYIVSKKIYAKKYIKWYVEPN